MQNRARKATQIEARGFGCGKRHPFLRPITSISGGAPRPLIAKKSAMNGVQLLEVDGDFLERSKVPGQTGAEVFGCLRDLLWAAEVAPVGVIGAKGKDSFSLRGDA